MTELQLYLSFSNRILELSLLSTMGKGHHLSTILRIIVFHMFVSMEMQPEDIHAILFLTGHAQAISVSHVKTLCNRINRELFNHGSAAEFLSGPRGRPGRRRMMTPFHDAYFIALVNENPHVGFYRLVHLYNAHMGNNTRGSTTLRRSMERAGYSRKVVERFHCYRSKDERRIFLAAIAPIAAERLIDIDETASSPEQYLRVYGYAPKGRKCYKTQFISGQRHFTVIAAYSVDGFLAWSIIEDAVTAENIVNFMQQLAPLIVNGFNFLLLDNASVDRTAEVVDALHQCSHGAYVFSPKYSPDLKPFERGFANIKRLLRYNEERVTQNPVEYLNRAFHIYSINGPRGYRGKPIQT